MSKRIPLDTKLYEKVKNEAKKNLKDFLQYMHLHG
jgi:hypothetical protein